ncbi:DUF58 domain-containing protein [Vulcanisaeta souniana]|uniref:DUF58 domain-containing protein n=2 Tax=Vulcanisaeta souniana TaxID=164452 RepID=A0A830E5K2_9CREN|nr:DUF58 domain-containing protein [Vulcanisaeta souniana]BDR91272.1 DUF58 domain-containing protein [Vulcanisaeta souniana JCM 11219]GGI84949.1 DUF58 domain-containing protein [Vulcanisaeta souniana JCM 11219]
MVREITKSYYLLLAIPIFVAIMAIIATAKELLMAVIFSALMVFLALITDMKPVITMNIDLPRTRVFAGDEVEARVRVRVKGGLGLVSIATPPASYGDSRRYKEGFDVVNGKAAQIVFKGFSDVEREFKFKVKALKRGVYDFGRIRYTYHHLFGLRIIEDEVNDDIKLVVMPRYRIIRRGVGKIKPSTVTPRVTPNRLGPHSTDFMDIREYVPGDPFKFINWKATARSIEGKLMVNNYEREGLRNVVFLIDLGPWMRLGYPHENPLEFGTSLVLSLTKVLLRYGYNVGLWTIPPSDVYVMPSSGQTQFYRVLSTLLRIEYVEEPRYEFADPALLRVIMETKPILIIITNMASKDVVNALRKSLCVGPGNRCRLLGRALVIDVSHGSIVMGEKLGDYEITTCIGRIGTRARLYKALPKGMLVVPWDPGCENVGLAVARLMPRVRWLS